jgi:hypothetical protein
MYVHTDHPMLENFNIQHNLSRCQACWMEFLTQFDCCIIYVKGQDNTVADALSRIDFGETSESLALAPFDEDTDSTAVASVTCSGTSPFFAACCVAHTCIQVPSEEIPNPICTILNISVDGAFVDSIRDGHLSDPWCAKLTLTTLSFPSLVNNNRLWHIGSCLIIARMLAPFVRISTGSLTTLSVISASTKATSPCATLTTGRT